MPQDPHLNNDFIKKDIKESQTSEEIRKETLFVLDKAEDVLSSNKKKYGENSDIYKNILKEYEKLRKTTIQAIFDDRYNTSSDLKSILSKGINGKIDRNEKIEIEKDFKEMLEKQNSREENEFLYGKNPEYIYLKTFSNEKLLEKILTKEELNKLFIKESLNEINQILSTSTINLDEDILGEIGLSGIKLKNKIIYIEEYDVTQVQSISILKDYIRQNLGIKNYTEKDKNDEKELKEIFNKGNGIAAGIQLNNYIVQVYNYTSKEDFGNFFNKNLKSFLLKNPESLEKFINLWGDENSGKNNLKMGLKRQEIENIIPELKEEYLKILNKKIKTKTEGLFKGEKNEEILLLSTNELILKINQTKLSKEKKEEILLLINKINALNGDIKNRKLTKGTYLERLSSNQLNNLSNSDSNLFEHLDENKAKEIKELSEKYSKILEDKPYLEKLFNLNEENYNKVIKKIEDGENFEKALINIDNSKEFQDLTENNNGTYSFNSRDGSKLENITKGELINLASNPESLKNFIDFKKTLEDLNLDFIWKNRQKFMLAAKNYIGVTAGFDNLDSDGISPGELKKILNFTLMVIGEEGDFNNLENLKEKVRSINKVNLNEKQNDVYGRSSIENRFIKKGYLNYHNALHTINIYALQDKNNWKNNNKK